MKRVPKRALALASVVGCLVGSVAWVQVSTAAPTTSPVGPDSGDLSVSPDTYFVGESISLTANFASNQKGKSITFYGETSADSGEYVSIGSKTANSSGNATLVGFSVSEARRVFARTSANKETEVDTLLPKLDVGSDGTISACFRKKDGALRVLLPPGNCGSAERPLTWSVAGEKGDKGDQGDQGPQGPGPKVVQVVGDGESGADNLGTTSTSFVDVSSDLSATLSVEAGDWIQMQFQANTDRSGSNFIFHYFTFSVDGVDIDTGNGSAPNRGGIAAQYPVDRPDAQGFGTSRVNISYWWQAEDDGEVVIRPRHKSDGAGPGEVFVVNNGDINPIFSAANFGQ